MKLNRKTILLGAFLFMDCVVGGVIIGKTAIKNATRRLFVPEESHEVYTIEDSMVFVNEGVANFIEYSVASEEDLLVAQEIIMNEQQELILEQKQISQAIVTSNKQIEAAKQAKIKAAQEAKAKAAAAKAAEERRKKAEEDAKQLQIALAQEAKAKAEAEAKAKAEAQKTEENTEEEGETTSNKVEVVPPKVSGYDIANYALKFNGKSYVFGGQWNGELPYTGTDCSGFTQGVYKHFGVTLPRVARDQAKIGKEVALKDIQPGDLVFYSGNGGASITHVSIYIGSGKIIHAQTPYLGIGISNIQLGTLIRTNIRRVI